MKTMSPTSIDSEIKYAESYGKKAVNWTVFKGCWLPPQCAIRGLCWAYSVAKRYDPEYVAEHGFMPWFYPERLELPKKSKIPRHVLVGWQGEIGALDFGQIIKLLAAMSDAPWHDYFFLTKQPQKFRGVRFPKNCHFGISLNVPADVHRRMGCFINLQIDAPDYFLYIEPCMGPVKQWQETFNGSNWFEGVKRVVFGGYSGGKTPKGYPAVEKETIEFLSKKAEQAGCEIQYKHNLRDIL